MILTDVFNFGCAFAFDGIRDDHQGFRGLLAGYVEERQGLHEGRYIMTV